MLRVNPKAASRNRRGRLVCYPPAHENFTTIALHRGSCVALFIGLPGLQGGCPPPTPKTRSDILSTTATLPMCRFCRENPKADVSIVLDQSGGLASHLATMKDGVAK